MNHIYRLCWNRTLGQWVPTSELARCKRGGASSGVVGRRALALSLLASSMGVAALAQAGNLPSGAQVVSGSGSVQQAANVTTIQQHSPVLSLNWQSFDIGAAQSVNFIQPGASSIAVNRIVGTSASQIHGHLNANGQVWLINPNGILFGKSSQVNVGGIVASTLDFDNSTLDSRARRFSGNGHGSVIAQGNITAADGGYVALLGNQVSNQGTIRARMGTVALGGGSAATLTFDDHHLLGLQVDQSTLHNLAENRQLIVADGGQVIMAAGARQSLLASAVNNTGTVQAHSVVERDGVITLLAGMDAGTVNVGGTLDASAPGGGNGGQIETSGAHFKLAPNARITAAAPRGAAGTWLVDPVDLTIDAAAAATISSALEGGTNVTEQTTATSAIGSGVQTPGQGDIIVNAPVSWSNPAASLNLQAYHGITVNAPVAGAGGVVLNAAGGDIVIASGASVSSGTGATLSTGARFINNGGAGALGSQWLLYSANPAQNTLGGLAPDFIQYNAPVQALPAASGNGLLYSLAPKVTVSGLTGTVSKNYDGTNSATLDGANLAASGLVNGDKVSTATGSYASTNAGTNIAVTSPGTAADFRVVDSNGIPVYGYGLVGTPVSANIGAITPAPITVQIVNNPTKVYNGTTSATLNAGNYQMLGFASGEGATLAQARSVAYAGADAGAQVLNATFAPTNFVAQPGTNLSNYALPGSGFGMGSITRAPVQVTGLYGIGKVYNGNNVAALDAGGAGIFGIIASDVGQVSLDTSGGYGTFASANVGNNINITAGGFQLAGGKANNYQLLAPSGLRANITPKSLAIGGITANHKTYDATTNATLDLGGALLGGVVAGDEAAVSLATGGYSAQFGQRNVGNNLAVTAGGFGLQGSAAGNYSLLQPAGLVANITPAALTITLKPNPTKTYDGSRALSLGNGDFTVTGFVGGESAAVAQSSASYATANAGTNIAVVATLQPSDFMPGANTSLFNYSFAPVISGITGTIKPQQLYGQLVGNPTKVYDGTTAATLSSSNYALYGFVGSDSASISPGTGTYASANAGVQAVTSAPALADYQAGGATLLSNYILPATFSGVGAITPVPLYGVLGASITGNATKVYDGSTGMLVAPGMFTLGGFVGTDSASVNGSIAAQFGDKNVGAWPITAALTPGDVTFTAGNSQNYTLPVTAYGTGTITPRPLTVGIINNPLKVYNGSKNVALSASNFSLTGFAPGEGGTINAPADSGYDSANAGVRTVTANLALSNYDFAQGTQFLNYQLPTVATGQGEINPAPLYVIGVYGTNKVYDTTTAATLNAAAAGLAGLVDADVGKVSLISSTSGSYGQANVGNGLAITANGFGISGNPIDVANYRLQPLAGLAGNITPAPLSLSGIRANHKNYDGTTAASLDIDVNAALLGILGSDSVTFASGAASGQFSTANAGNNLGVTTSGFSLGGFDAGNYRLIQPAGLSANINRAPLTATIIANPTKVYDGSNSLSLTAANFRLDGFAAGEGATVPQSASANYSTSNVGNNLGVQATMVVSDFIASAGTNLSNYILPTTGAGTGGVIRPKVLDLSGTRIYDATTGANASLFGPLFGIDGELLTVSGQGSLASKNVGAKVAVTDLGNLVLGGAGTAGNYTLVGGANWVTITPASLNASFTARNRAYDGSKIAALDNVVLSGRLLSDDVSLTNTATGLFADKNVGIGKAVTANMGLAGLDAANYTLTQGTAAADVGQFLITISASAQNKQYDGKVNASVQVAGNGVLSGDQVNFTASSSTFGDANVGSGKTVTVSGINVGGADAANYKYVLDNATTTTTADITPRVLNLTGSRQYDATTTVNASLFAPTGTIGGVNGEKLKLSGSTALANKNVGNQKTFAGLGTLTLADDTGMASNYTLVGGTDWLTVTAKPLTATFTADSRIYDRTSLATLRNAMLAGLIGGDDVVLGNPTAGTFANKNVGVNKTVTGAMTLSGADVGNYAFTQGTASASITPLAITVAATGQNKIYDGNANGSVSLGSAGILAGDALSFSSTGSVFADRNAGSGKTVSVSGISGSGADSANYTFNSTATTTANITPRVLNLAGNRVYDATTAADASLFAPGGTIAGINGELLALTGSAVLNNKNVGINKAFASLGTLALGDNGAALAGNYTLVGGIDRVTVTAAPLTATFNAVSRSYDGTRLASLQNAALAGLLGSDAVVLGNASAGTFADKNAGTGKAVTVNMNISGTDAGNYVFTQGTAAADITRLGITVNASAQDKVYDRTADAGTILGSVGILAGDTLAFSSASSVFADRNAGNGKTVSVSGITASGADAGNYSFNTEATTTANITPRGITVAAIGQDKVYDRSTNGSAFLGSAGILAGDSLAFSSAASVFGDRNVGNGKTLSVTGITASGADAGNYTYNTSATTTANITPLAITVAAIGQDKVYDRTSIGNALLGSAGILAGDSLAFDSAASVFADHNVGNGKTLWVSGITGTGADVGNYTFNTTATTTANITPRGIIVAAAGLDKVYDGTVDGAALLSSAGILAGDSLAFGSAAPVFADRNAGNGKTLSVSGITASGDGASNYTFNTTASTTASVTPKAVTVTASAAGKSYDGNTAASVALDAAGLVAGDAVAIVSAPAVFSDANAASGKTVLVNGITGRGADAGNYTFNDSTATTADITPRVLDLAGSRVYDTTTAADASLFAPGGTIAGVNGELLALSGSAVLNSKNVGINKPFAGLATLALGDNGGALASNYTLVGGTDWVTIIAAPLTATFDAASRSYNGTRLASLRNGTLAGLLGSDKVVLGNASAGSFADKNAGTGKTVTGNMSISGTDAGNYVFTQGTAMADITRLGITVGAAARDKVYDRSVDASTSLDSAGILAGDSLAFSSTASVFGDRNAGNGKTVSVSGITASGADAGNYSFNTTATTTANITPRPISVSAVGSDKPFDGNTSATVGLGASGVLPGEQVELAYDSANFADSAAGQGKTIVVRGITGAGADAGNYVIVDPTVTAVANIVATKVPVPLGLTEPAPAAPVVRAVAEPPPAAPALIGTTLLQINNFVGPSAIATPYGIAEHDTVGSYTGNHKKRHSPVERNRAHADFRPGLRMQVIDGGIRMPADAAP